MLRTIFITLANAYVESIKKEEEIHNVLSKNGVELEILADTRTMAIEKVLNDMVPTKACVCEHLITMALEGEVCLYSNEEPKVRHVIKTTNDLYDFIMENYNGSTKF